MTASRRDLLSALTGLLAAAGVPRVLAAERALELRLGPPEPFSAAMVRDRARALAAEPFGLDQALPEALAALEHGQYQGIRFRPEMALWHGLDLDVEAQFFHLGGRFRTPMHIYDVAGGLAREVLYQPELFDFGGNGLVLDLPEDLGFAGFRLHYPLNRPDHLDELAVFLGASYFRALGRNQRYGISARGVAIDTGLPKAEEFPAFRRFWLERPVPDADQLVLHALLDGPSLTGAYVFRLRPGKTTVMDVEASLFAREAIELLGIAPLTSMFLFGPNDQLGVDDFRPGVHDSEGLQIWSSSGEWSWRPLVNPEQLRLSLFGDTDLKGFGLMQRIRDFAAYEDLEARYDLRPSLWVEPLAPWGNGHVRLIEIPSPQEVYDNIVAFWVPKQPVEPGSEWNFQYRLHWSMEPPVRPDLGEAVATRVGAGGAAGEETDRRRLVIDFVGGRLEDIPPGVPVEAVMSVIAGEVIEPIARKNGVTGGWRVLFDLRPEGDGPVELRCVLRLADETLTETWVYQWTP
ncbi:MAG TPA: glucan biosynthesis protein G [Geminicoccaceae bacterium]|nr:glucan biosynthesis protein G [Geminicoccaceae bacterium]